MKNSSDTIENRTSDLPACRAVPQPTTPPRVPVCLCSVVKYRLTLSMLNLTSRVFLNDLFRVICESERHEASQKRHSRLIQSVV